VNKCKVILNESSAEF